MTAGLSLSKPLARRPRLADGLGPTPRNLAVAFVVLIGAWELKFRRRDLEEALAGGVDAQVVTELVLWGLVVAWVILTTMRRRPQDSLLSLRSLGPALRAVLAVTALVIVTSLYAPSVRSVVKAVEFGGLTLLTVFAFNVLRKTDQGTGVWWVSLRRAVWVMAVLATLLTFLFFFPVGEFLASFTQTHIRFGWMTVHPIATAGMLSLALLMQAGAFLGRPDPMLAQRGLRFQLLAATSTLILITTTKARGAFLGCTAGIATMAALTGDRHRRRLAALAVWGMIALPLLGVGDQALERTLIRNQSVDQLMTLSERTILIERAWPMVLERPWFGHGYLATASALTEIFPWAGEGHNVLLEAAFNFGLLGVILFLILWVQIGRQLLKAVRFGDPDTRPLAIEAVAVAIFLLLLSVIGDSFAGIPGFETVGLMWLALMSDLLGRRVSADRPAITRRSPAA